MQVSVENTGSLERRLKVQVPGQEIQDKVEAKLKEMTREVRIKGFRPGRVPLSVVRQRYGRQVRLDVVNEAMQQSLQQAIIDEQLRPAAPPRLDAEPQNIDGGDLEFTALVEVYPEIGELDINTIELARPEAGVTDADVDEMLQTLREQRKTWEDVERAGQPGDRVLVDYSAETESGRVPEENVLRMAVVLGESGFDELEQAVTGAAAGDERNAEITFPESFHQEQLAGVKAPVALKVTGVAEGKLPEVDAEFIQGFGVEDGDIDTLKVEIRGNLERELKQATNTLLKTRLIEALVEQRADLEVPESVARQEATGLAAQATGGGDEAPDPAVVDAFMDTARQRVRAGMLMGELAHQNDIHVDATRVREAIEVVANTYEQPAEVMQLYYGNQRLLQQVESSVLEEQVVDWAIENAKVTSENMSFQDVINAATKAANQA